MVCRIKEHLLQFQSSFFSNVVKRGLGMMIPFILTGCMACALRDFPLQAYQSLLETEQFHWLYVFFHMVNSGIFGIFSLLMVVSLSLSYAMESNENHDFAGMYIVVSLGAFGTQWVSVNGELDMDVIGVQGCFAAIVITYLSCKAYSALKKVRLLSLEDFTAGMGGVAVPAIQSFLPMVIVVAVVTALNQLLCLTTGASNFSGFISNALCSFVKNIGPADGFASGLFYTLMSHLLWFFGMHGSHILEPVALTNFAYVEGRIFSKAFYDTYVSIGGTGSTICLLFAMLIFFRKERYGKIAKLASFSCIFNINEILTFGIPVILNPFLFIPFILVPVIIYSVSYAATAAGIVPLIIKDGVWTTPVFLSGYINTGSIRGTLLQIVCVAAGTAIYLPFLRMNRNMEEEYSRQQVKSLVQELQAMEEAIDSPDFLTRGDLSGTVARMLLSDLKSAIRNRDLFLLYQPQVNADGRCMGAEALLRWVHPLYGMIYPPLIIYLAEEGGILPDLEDMILDEAAHAIAKVQEAFDGPFKISVNLTAHSLLWDVEKCIDHHLKDCGVSKEKLWIEITEQDILLQTDLVIKKLNDLKEAGHMLLIDDFGMGHTSLLYLQSSYFGIVKLDGSLIRDLPDNETNQKIVSSIVQLGKELGVGIIAEYVETEEIQKLLESLGCNNYQGYLYSKPVPVDEFITFILERAPEKLL